MLNSFVVEGNHASVCVSGVLQAHSQGAVSRGWEAEHCPGSAAALSRCGEQREEL